MKFVVLGDLHLDQRAGETFVRARDQIRALGPEAIICLGDLGSGDTTGTRAGFEAARTYLASFGVPYFALLGNHDLERLDHFASDADVVSCFSEIFKTPRPYQTFELGTCLGILLSSTGFRDNHGYKHEIAIDDQQFDWFHQTLAANRERPTLVFSHAPPLGSHLRVLQYPHLRAGNAWLNQSNEPRRFLDLLREHPQVRLWFSAHNHLGQHYPNSASLVGRCLFVHAGVIGEASRDGRHHSRMATLEADTGDAQTCIRIDTLDHASSRQVPDLRFDLKENRIERASLADTGADAGANEKTDAECSDRFYVPPPYADVEHDSSSIRVGQSLFYAHRDMLVEYDQRHCDPIGVVEDRMGHTRVTADGDCLVLHSWLGKRRFRANSNGFYFQIPSQSPRLLNKLRAAVSLHRGRWRR